MDSGSSRSAPSVSCRGSRRLDIDGAASTEESRLKPQRGCRRNQIEDSAAARVQPSAFSDQLSFQHSASRWVHPQSRDIRVGAADLGAKYERPLYRFTRSFSTLSLSERIVSPAQATGRGGRNTPPTVFGPEQHTQRSVGKGWCRVSPNFLLKKKLSASS